MAPRASKITDLLRKKDLSELVLGPLSDQIDQARIQILQRISEINDSANILARQKRRDMDTKCDKDNAFENSESCSNDSAGPGERSSMN